MQFENFFFFALMHSKIHLLEFKAEVRSTIVAWCCGNISSHRPRKQWRKDAQRRFLAERKAL
jgi:hypothetical protein